MNGLKFFIKNYGCQMNIYDSEKMCNILFSADFELSNTMKDANLVILNTCFIREKAEDKLFSDLGRVKEFKLKALSEQKIFLIAVVGCVSQARGDIIQKRAPYVDIVIGPQEVHKILFAINECFKEYQINDDNLKINKEHSDIHTNNHLGTNDCSLHDHHIHQAHDDNNECKNNDKQIISPSSINSLHLYTNMKETLVNPINTQHASHINHESNTDHSSNTNSNKHIHNHTEKNNERNVHNLNSNNAQKFSKSFVNQQFEQDKKHIFINLKNTGKFDEHDAYLNKLSSRVSNFLTIQEGCNNFCTYCVVPYTRGREYSRTVKDIINEARFLVSNGTKEIILLGQNVNSYFGENLDGKNVNMASLIHELANIDGLKRLKYMTSNPKDMTDDLIQAHKDIDILMPFLHLPVQSGSDAVLQKMNRQYTKDSYKTVIDKLYTNIPNMAITSDFIVGFPGETDKDFQETLDIVKYVNYAQSYSFKYSKRPMTPAQMMEDQIDEEIKQERLEILQELLLQQQTIYNQKTLGMTLDVLLEKEGNKNNQLGGRTQFGQAIVINQPTKKINQHTAPIVSDQKKTLYTEKFNNEEINSNSDKLSLDDVNVIQTTNLSSNNRELKIGDVIKVQVSQVLSHSLVGEIIE